MNDIIYKQEAIDEIMSLIEEPEDDFNEGVRMAACVVFQLSPAQPERKTGDWEEIEVLPEAYDIAGVKTWASKMRCNQCGFTTFAIEGHFAQYDFCPHCGADMR